jgi:hypothetical protein
MEADLFIGLTLAEEEPGDGLGGDYRSRTRLVEDEDAWTLRFEGVADGTGPRIDVVVPRESETAARRDGLTFGAGTSQLIDAGQWVQIAAVYARRAMRESLRFARDRTDVDLFRDVVRGWEIAHDALAEAAKFLPDEADEIPATACWTPLGTTTREEAPERFTRVGLDRDLVFYRRSLDDFRRLHGDRGP